MFNNNEFNSFGKSTFRMMDDDIDNLDYKRTLVINNYF